MTTETVIDQMETSAIRYANTQRPEDWNAAKLGYMAGGQDQIIGRLTEGEWFIKTNQAMEAYYRYHRIKRDGLPEADKKALERICVGLLQLSLEQRAD